jgi:prolyl-tRNA editing enzyme YbaK/EbsC (Cys-tRNA(Pro) deacylase)
MQKSLLLLLFAVCLSKKKIVIEAVDVEHENEGTRTTSLTESYENALNRITKVIVLWLQIFMIIVICRKLKLTGAKSSLKANSKSIGNPS